MFVKTGDKVMVIAGKDKGKTGTITKVLPKQDRVIVEGINMMKKHMKPSQTNPSGSVTDKEAPIHVSNVMLVDPETNEASRVKKEITAEGKKVRVFKKSGKQLDK